MNVPAAQPLSIQDYLAMTGPPPSAHLPYGAAPSQYVELFQPAGAGPFPVVFLVHGGCWKKVYGGIEQMRNLAGALISQGIAVWNVEYRRVEESGGGYPGTYQDVGAALDLLAASAAARHLDPTRVVAVGHSAGGHLVQWLAGRRLVPSSSALHSATPVALRQVIGLGTLGDLRTRSASIQSDCEVDMTQVVGVASAARPDVYSDTNPAQLMPNGSHTVLVNGDVDTISPPQTAYDYAALARKAGDSVDVVVLPRASHFDEVSAASPSWRIILPLIRRALALEP